MVELDAHFCIEEEQKTCLKMDAERIYVTFLIFFPNSCY